MKNILKVIVLMVMFVTSASASYAGSSTFVFKPKAKESGSSSYSFSKSVWKKTPSTSSSLFKGFSEDSTDKGSFVFRFPSANNSKDTTKQYNFSVDSTAPAKSSFGIKSFGKSTIIEKGGCELAIDTVRYISGYGGSPDKNGNVYIYYDSLDMNANPGAGVFEVDNFLEIRKPSIPWEYENGYVGKFPEWSNPTFVLFPKYDVHENLIIPIDGVPTNRWHNIENIYSANSRGESVMIDYEKDNYKYSSYCYFYENGKVVVGLK